ncbi:VapE domain-containing protein [Novosphingobium sp.]|uniref:VapE domain-containing protein n=1 Tax=Novosphingobium sp. TaxID=1874826 RepID=UPI003B5239DA
MTKNSDAPDLLVLESAKPYHDQGFALHLLHEKQKRPIEDAWASKPRAGWDDLRRGNRAGLNLGVRLGKPSKIGDLYLHVIDMDIRKPERATEAHAAIAAALPEWRNLPSVISGSGGEARHIYFLSDAQFTSKVFAHSADNFVGADGKTHWVWELELFGTGKQVVFPGSIHPHTGLPYRWEREFDFDDLDMGLGPYVSSEVVLGWAQEKPVADLNEDYDLLREVLEGPLDDFSLARGKEVLSVFKDSWWDDRDSWLHAGMALHHQFDGSDAAFDLWCELSQASTKFDKRVQRQQWKSLKAKLGGITMRSILREAAGEGFKQSIGDEAEDSLDDMIGGEPAPATPFAAPAPKYLVAPLPHDEDWRDRLVKVNKAKKTKDDPEPDPIWVLTPGLQNTRILIQHDIRLRDTFAYNAFAQSIVLVRDARRKKAKSGQPCYQLEGCSWKLEHRRNGDIWSDSREHDIRAMIETPENQGGYGMKIADRDLHSAIDIVANKRRFHPVQEYIKALPWDGVPRAETLFIDFLGCTDTPYHREISRLTLLAAVTRVFEPGHKWDYVPIIEGAQGKGKSTFISILAHNWFSELANDFTDDKKMVESMKGSWIIEIGELSGFSKHDNGLIKQFVTRTEDKVRMAYAHHVSHVKRQCIFIGSTNDRRYLRDETGNRRFWPVVSNLPGQIDNVRLRAVIGLVWAEVLVMYQKMRAERPDESPLPLYLTNPDAAFEAEELQESRRVETADDTMLGQVQRWLDEPVKGDGMDEGGEAGSQRKVTCLLEIAVDCLGIPAPVYVEKRTMALQLSNVMTRVTDWRSSGRKRFEEWGQQRTYERIAA